VEQLLVVEITKFILLHQMVVFQFQMLETQQVQTTVDYLVVAGGGGGGGTNGPGCGGRGGGGGGGFRVSNGYAIPAPTMSPLAACVSSLPVTATTYPITVGSGGSGGAASQAPTGHGSQGSNSIFSTITSAGGGAGASYPTSPIVLLYHNKMVDGGGGSWAGAAGGCRKYPTNKSSFTR
jgi:hypothetical protein